MENETGQIFEEQLKKLPKQVVDFLGSTEWNTRAEEIASSNNLSREESVAFEGEVTLVLIGLTHPDEFTEVIKEHLGLEDSVAETLAKEASEVIFTPILPALLNFFRETEEKEEATKAEAVEIGIETPIIPRLPQRTWEKEPDIAPANLPTDEKSESFLPPIPPKNIASEESGFQNWDITPTHPFEEKMKKVFTAGSQSMGELSLDRPIPQTTAPTPSPQTEKSSPLHSDPYREPIEY